MTASAGSEPESRRPRRISLTGGIACGKSLVGDYLRQRGIPVIDADEVVHRLLRKDTALKHAIRDAFGDDVFMPGGEVDRATLGGRVFGNPAARRQLEGWIHPKVRETIDRFYENLEGIPAGIAVIPLLFESGLESDYDEVWLLETPEALQLERLLTLRGMTREDAQARIRSQLSAEEKRQRLTQHSCGRIFHNTDTPEALYRQIDQALFQAPFGAYTIFGISD